MKLTKENRLTIIITVFFLLTVYVSSIPTGIIQLRLLCDGDGLSTFTQPITKTETKNLYQVGDRQFELRPAGTLIFAAYPKV